jgi:hypothetical protein
MRAIVLSKIPDTNTSSTITADNFALVRVDDYIIYWAAVGIASLNSSTSSLPNLHGTILRTCNHPFSFAMERNASYISGMSFEGEKRIGVC